MLTSPNALPPGEMTSEERLREVARLLAAGVLRLHRHGHLNEGDKRPVRLDNSPRQSGRLEPQNVRPGETA